MATLTTGEACFAEYLEQESYRYEHEPNVGGRHPDFVVDRGIAGRAAYEVFEPADNVTTNTVGSLDSYAAIRRGVDKRKYEQAKAARGAGLPFVLAVVPTRMRMAPDPQVVAGAMFGDLTVTFRVTTSGSADTGDDGSLHFGSNGRLQSSQQRAVSAVALLRWFNPTVWRLHAAGRAAARGSSVRTGRDAVAHSKLFEELATDLADSGVYQPLSVRYRLVVLHNPHAYVPLPLDFTDGPHDEQHSVFHDGAGWRYGPVALGAKAWEVPSS